jgi:hypothetical protein
MNQPKILYYGNCQVGAVSNTLGLSQFIKLIACWECDNMSNEEFLGHIRQADIIITQPINNDYKGKNYLSTEYIVKNCREDTKIFIFPSIYFEFYYPDLMYKVLDDGSHLNEPSAYHYKCVIENYEKGLDFILENYTDNKNYKSYDELLDIAERSIKELKRREELMDDYIVINPAVKTIKVSDYIRQNYRDRLLFYSMNHPTLFVIQYVAEKIKDELSFGEINYNFDGLFGNERGILYSCVQKCLNFDQSTCIPRLSKYNLEDKRDIISKYIKCYTNTN